jgi:hypothetical protein
MNAAAWSAHVVSAEGNGHIQLLAAEALDIPAAKAICYTEWSAKNELENKVRLLP